MCERCGEHITNDIRAYYGIGGEPLCESCFDELYVRCELCGDVIRRDESETINILGDIRIVCPDCAESIGEVCSKCGEFYIYDSITFIDGEAYCEECLPDLESSGQVAQCEECGEYFHTVMMKQINGHWYCEDCAEVEETA